MKPKADTSATDNVPLPIQTFLWRQTNPFICGKPGNKLQEASCVTFERVVAQNILHGLSPSLSDAINSISRWRFIQAAFPHIVHCCSCILADRKPGDQEKLSQSQIKLLYLLHWMIYDAAGECMDSDTSAAEKPFTHYLFPLNCVQVLVYLMVPLAGVIKQSDLSNIRLESGVPFWQALWDYRQPDVVCFCAPVKPKVSQAQFMPLLKKSLVHTAEQDIYMGGSGTKDTGGIYLGGSGSVASSREFRTDTLGSNELITRKGPSIVAKGTPQVTPIIEEDKVPPPPPIPLQEQPSETRSKQKPRTSEDNGAGSVIRSVSAYQKKKQPLSIDDVARYLKYVEEGTADSVQISDKAPLVCLQEICETAWSSVDAQSITSSSCLEQMYCEVCNTVLRRQGDSGTIVVCKCDHQQRKDSNQTTLTVGAPTIVESIRNQTAKSNTPSASVVTGGSDKKDKQPTSLVLSPGGVSSPPLRKISDRPMFPALAATNDRKVSSPIAQFLAADALQASYFDVAVLRCLFVRQWTEPGVFWALQYLYQRLLEISNAQGQRAWHRQRSNSMPLPKLKVTPARTSPIQSKTDLDMLNPELNKRTPTWRQLHPLADYGISSTSAQASLEHKSKVAFSTAGDGSSTKLDGRKTKSQKKQQLDVGELQASRSASLVLPANVDERRRSSSSLRHVFEKAADSAKSVAVATNRRPPTESDPPPPPQPLPPQPTTRTVGHHDMNAGSLGSLTRSVTDTNISYVQEMMAETAGSSAYIHRNGHLNLKVVLQAVSSTLQRKLSLRVCEITLNLLDVLLETDLNDCSSTGKERNAQNSPNRNNSIATISLQTKFGTTVGSLSPRLPADQTSAKAVALFQEPTELFLLAVIRVYLFLGCPHGCSESVHGPSVDYLRGQARNCLSRLQKNDSRCFAELLERFIEQTELVNVIDFLHAFTGFCQESTSVYRGRVTSHGSNEGPRSRTGDTKEAPSYRNCFLKDQKGVEGFVIESIFKPLVTIFMRKMTDLQQPESMSLFHDIRSLVNYIQDSHGNPFRIVALSGLRDAIDPPKPRPSPAHHKSFPSTKETRKDSAASSSVEAPFISASPSTVSTVLTEKPRSLMLPSITVVDAGADSRSLGSIGDTESESDSNRQASPLHGNGVSRETMPSLRRTLFTRARKEKQQQPQHDDAVEEDEIAVLRHEFPSTEDLRLTPSPSPLNFQQKAHRKQSSKFQKALNMLKAVKSDTQLSSSGQQTEESDPDLSDLENQGDETASSPRSGNRRLAKRISFKNAAHSIKVLHKVMKDGNKRKSIESGDTSAQGAEAKATHENQVIIDQLMIPARNMVNVNAILEGSQRFAFLLETCQPGSVPDPQLLAALLDLQAPVLARATIFMECAFFVHRCTKGQWPEWIRSGATVAPSRASHTLALGNRGTPSGIRKTNVIQRNAGKLFYNWAECLGARLEVIIQEEKDKAEAIVKLPADEQKRRQLRVNDDLEDFLDDGSVNPSGEECPFALKMLAAVLLMEITAFLRETFQYLPRLKGPTKSHAPSSGWEKILSHRRWSILSNTFNPSQHSGSVHSVAGLGETMFGTAGIGERRISFCHAHEDVESQHSSGHSTADELPAITSDRKTTCPSSRMLSLHKQASTVSHNSLLSVGSPLNSTVNLANAIAMFASTFSSLPIPPEYVSTTGDSKCSTTAASSAAAVRRLAQGRQKFLKRGVSASTAPSAPTSGSSFRRKSYKLKKRATHDQIDTDPSGRKDSVKSRKESTISEDDHSGAALEQDLSPRGSGAGDGLRQVESPVPEEATPATGATATQSDQEDAVYYSEFPWLKTLIKLANTSNLICNHQRYCHPYCFQRQLRQCFRLQKALRKVYGEEIPFEGQLDRRKQLIESLQEKSKMRQSSCSRRRPTSGSLAGGFRRESAFVRGSTLQLRGLGLLLEAKELAAAAEDSKDKDKNGGTKRSPCSETIRPPKPKKPDKELPMLAYLRNQVHSSIHSPLTTLLKGTLVMHDWLFLDILPVTWELLLESDAQLVSSAAAVFIVSSVKQPESAVKIMKSDLNHKDITRRICAVLRFYTLWKNRYHCWAKMEEGAHMVFKVPPPGIDFTLPSPPIGQVQPSCVDPPWAPHIKTKVQELTITEEDTTSQTIMTMTKTRRKQKQEFLQRARQQAEEKKAEERKRYKLMTVCAPHLAAFEPALFQLPTTTIADLSDDDPDHPTSKQQQQIPVAQPLFPSCLCSVVPLLVKLLDDSDVNPDGVAVGEVARNIIWNCLVEDTALFIRYFLEKLTVRDKQEQLIATLRRLVLNFRQLPPQAGFTMLNYLFGFVMYCVRQPCETSQESIGAALSLIWLVIPSVYCLFFKDLKQTLRKEQCDAVLMITANVPSTKKLIVHGPDQGSIPSQFPIQEDTQFLTILTDSLDFFNINESEAGSYFLMDAKTGMLHSPQNYVRDFYFFRRTFYPQLNLVHLNPEEAALKLNHYAIALKFIEMGKVLLSSSSFKAAPEHLMQQRIFFLHEELSKLPSFPRKALEACFGMYRGSLGKELHGVEMMHKLSWLQLMAQLLNNMEASHAYGDLHLFINVINGILLMHAEDTAILRLSMATYVNISRHFKTLFFANGFFMIMPTILRVYSQHQTNLLLCTVIEYTCKQFYLMHRKPFVLQMFGSIANIIDCSEDDEVDSMKVKAYHLFLLLKAMENMDNQTDQLELMSLVEGEKPLKPLDFCYRDDPNTFCILTDALASCVTISAYAPESRRSHQMLVVIDSLLSHFLQNLQDETKKAGSTTSALKHELHVLTTLIVQLKALINCCDVLGRSFSGPQRNFDIVNVSGRGRSTMCESPQYFDVVPDDAIVIRTSQRNRALGANSIWDQGDDSEIQREVFRKPRDALLCVAAEFVSSCSQRLKELAKLLGEQVKIPELMDQKCQMRLSEIAHSLLKLAPYDPNTMACEGLQRYFLDILPQSDWSQEQSRSALSLILRRLDKTFSKIGKRGGLRRRTNWSALANWLHGLYQTISNFPYMAHLHFLKTTVQLCLKLVVGDPTVLGGGDESVSSVTHNALPTVLSNCCPPYTFCFAVIKLASLLMQTLGTQSFSLEAVCSADSLGSSADKLEAVLCHILLPLFLRAGSARKDAPQLRKADISFSIQYMLSAVLSYHPTRPSSSLGPPVVQTMHVPKGDSMRLGSISGSERQVFGPPAKPVSDSIYQTVFLGLKMLITSFEKKLSWEWVKIAKCIRELGQKHLGGAALWNFLDFILSTSTPLELILRPFIEHKLLITRATSEEELHWQELVKERLSGTYHSFPRSKGTVLKELAAELKNLRDDLATKTIENHSRTPTIIADMHSDSSSMHSTGRRQSDSHRMSESRRFSGGSRISRLSPNPHSKPAGPTSTTSPQDSSQSQGMEDSTIMEEEESLGFSPICEEQVIFVETGQPVLPHSKLHRCSKSTIRMPRSSMKRGRKQRPTRSQDTFDLQDVEPTPEVQFELTPRTMTTSASLGLTLSRAKVQALDPQTSTETLDSPSPGDISSATVRRCRAISHHRSRSPSPAPVEAKLLPVARTDSADSTSESTEHQCLLKKPT